MNPFDVARYAAEETVQDDLFAMMPAEGTKTPPRVAGGRDVAAAFIAFHCLNPWFADALERLALHWHKTYTRTRIDLLTSQLVLTYYKRTDSIDRFVFSNDFRPYYARLLLARHPEWAGTFLRTKETTDEAAKQAAVTDAEAMTTWGAAA